MMISSSSRRPLVLLHQLCCLLLLPFALGGRRLLLTTQGSENYAVIFDAGSSGSRVHVFRFDTNMDLTKIGLEYDVYEAIEPGLSSYADDPQAAAASIQPLLLKAESVVPQDLRSQTPVRLGATAGLRLLEGDAPEKILEAVRNLIKTESSLQYKAEWITVLDGTDEGAYLWIAINYLLGALGKTYQETVCTIDLGGGSVQVAYAVSNQTAAEAPSSDDYVQGRSLMGAHYNLYTHSYLNYGLLAARAEFLKASNNSANPCIAKGFDGTYEYNGVVYKASAFPSGPRMKLCRKLIQKALNIDAPCEFKKCTFNGVWNGGGGEGQKNIYAASNFYDVAEEVGIVDSSMPSAVHRPKSYMKAAKVVCATRIEEMKSKYPNAYDSALPYLCMDLLYEFTLLVDGYGLDPLQEIKLVSQVQYKDSLLEAAWPLGSAIDVVSST